MIPLPTAVLRRPTAMRAGRARRLLVVGTLVIGLAACSGSSSPDSTAATTVTDDPTATTVPPSTAPPTSAPPTSDAPTAPPPDDTTAALPDCDDERRDELETLVGMQLDAFATDDFAGAHELASTTFRGGIDVKDFEAVIREQYPVVLDDTDPAYGRCVSTAAQGVLEVGLSGPDGVASLVYLLVRENGRWTIDGAQYSTPPADDDTIET